MARIRLQPRERNVLVLGSIAALVILAYWGAQGPYAAFKASRVQLAAARNNLQQAQIWAAEVEQARKKERQILAQLASQSQGFDLWTHIDRTVKALGLGPRCDIRTVSGMGASAARVDTVELTLSGVSTKELIDLFHRIYDSGYVILLHKMEHLKPSPDGKGLDCKVSFAAPKVDRQG